MERFCLVPVSEVKLLGRVQLFATPWTVAYQALRSLSVHGIFQARVLEWVAISFSSTGLQILASSNPSVQFSSVAQSCPTLCNPMNCSTPGRPVHHQLPEFTQTQVHQVSDAIQPSYPLSPSPPAPNPSQHQGLGNGKTHCFFFPFGY